MNKYILATGLTAALLTATPAFADTHGGLLTNLGFSSKVHVDSDSDANEQQDPNASAGIGAQVRLLARERDSEATTSRGIGAFVKSLAHEFERHERGTDNDKKKNHATSTSATGTVNVNISGTVSAINGSTLTIAGKNGASYTVNAANATITGGVNTLAGIKLGDKVTVRGTLDGSLITATRIADKTFMQNVISTIDSIRAGVVSTLTGTGFTLNNGSTSVTTNGSTTVIAKGGATTTAAVTTGSNVLVFGTGSTSAPDSITASIVLVFENGVNFLRQLFFR